MRIGIDARKISDYGIGTYIRGLLGALAATGDDELIAFAPAGAALPDGVARVVVDAPHYSLRELVAVGRAADRAHLDLFHAPHYVVPFTGVPVVVTIHDLIHLTWPPKNPLAPFYARAMLGRAVRKARRVLTVSEASKRAIVETLLVSPDDVVVTPNGIDERFFASGPYPLSAIRYFLFVGNDKPHKNLGVLKAAVARLRGVRLVIAGGANFVSGDELAALYRGAIALVMPSAEEGFGLPAAEAMACGTAVITSRAAALVEITGDAALHVDAEPRALAAAMQRLVDDGDLRRALSIRGRERARTMTWTRCAELTRAAYRVAVA
ncbi:MAG TPA: glycosyltransferase family 1 protein [Thermoanaerobaculia bacterium]|nr:glycosyltransferase family 1 protein [Thermoanaerobaculia bacterium]